MFRALGWFLLALAFFAVGADLYWSWKGAGWTYQPISYYLDRMDAGWLAEMRAAALRGSPKFLDAIERFIAWPVWGPAFVLGILCATLGATGPGRRQAERPRERRSAWPAGRRRR